MKAAYSLTSEQRAMEMDVVVFGLDQMQITRPWETSRERNGFFERVFNEKALHTEKFENYLVRSLWSASFEYLRCELSLGNNPRPESGNVERL